MHPTILLFDIDGTLIDTGGAGRRSMERAFECVTGRADACAHFSFDGMTDRAIVRRGLDAVGTSADEPAIDRVLDAYLEALVAEVAASTGYVTHPGIDHVLAHAARFSHIALGLGTGNVRDGARIKLDRASLFGRFSFGGFGCDAEERARILDAGARRGAELLGKDRGDCRVVVIGDTPKDIAAAQAIGAESLAVGTGRFVPEDLAKAGATFVCDNLLSPNAFAMLFPDA
ncbi:HAD hydrolase-like protein [Polyangium sp. 15x6]|uniref:HAD family hydrolase n=1 Tax=Polyangium sp. 15x6 TaxID=3042687 RepID=UPI00249C0C3A|nr:HAD hydrolase-like protein [Polyangium sp. 15x6]MDI3290728.1 HAD hydrolase-like protein [Polyangium sp. 15x6]